MKQLAVQYPDVVKMKRIGLTAEGRDLYVLSLEREHEHPAVQEDEEDLDIPDGKKKKKKKGKKPKHPGHERLDVVVVGAQHGREVRISYLIRPPADPSPVDCDCNVVIPCPCLGCQRDGTSFTQQAAQWIQLSHHSEPQP